MSETVKDSAAGALARRLDAAPQGDGDERLKKQHAEGRLTAGERAPRRRRRRSPSSPATPTAGPTA